MPALNFDNLEAELTANETVDGSAAQLITALAAEIEANKGDPAKLQALADRLKASNATLSAAVLAGTPGQPPAGESSSRSRGR